MNTEAGVTTHASTPTTLPPQSPALTPPPPPPPKALAPGFRFHPSDEELVSYYLKRKVSNRPLRFNAIADVDIYKMEPWELAGKSRLKTRDQEWYFFSLLDKKYGNGARMNRATNSGYWKATGKDREIRRDSQLIAMKKTLVFHMGRAPGGERTNWVMHEYRLLEEEPGAGANQTDYVLCRVFHKNNIGPPNGNRYAPFLEEEWDDDKSILVPGEDTIDEASHDANAAKKHVEQVTTCEVKCETKGQPCNPNLSLSNAGLKLDHQSMKDTHSMNKHALNGNALPWEIRNAANLGNTESNEDRPPVCVLNTEAPFPLLQYKRRRSTTDRGSSSDASDNSTKTIQDPCSSTITTAAKKASLTNEATATAVSALLEFSLMESVKPKETPPAAPPPKFDVAAYLGSALPPSCMKFITDLQSEIHKISVERETLRLEMMSAQAMINILQSRIDYLNQENEEFKRSIREGK